MTRSSLSGSTDRSFRLIQGSYPPSPLQFLARQEQWAGEEGCCLHLDRPTHFISKSSDTYHLQETNRHAPIPGHRAVVAGDGEPAVHGGKHIHDRGLG